jgi:hypothetical protein
MSGIAMAARKYKGFFVGNEKGRLMKTSNFEIAEAVQPVAAADIRKALFNASSIRSRRSRERRRDGMRCVTIEIRDEELDVFVRRGLLSDAARCDVEAIKRVIYSHFDATLV